MNWSGIAPPRSMTSALRRRRSSGDTMQFRGHHTQFLTVSQINSNLSIWLGSLVLLLLDCRTTSRSAATGGSKRSSTTRTTLPMWN